MYDFFVILGGYSGYCIGFLVITAKLCKDFVKAYTDAYSYSEFVFYSFAYFFGYFGVLGVLVYLLLITCIFKHEKSKKQSRKDLNFMFAAIFILFGFTAGIFFNLRIFCIYLLMFLPMLYKKEERVA